MTDLRKLKKDELLALAAEHDVDVSEATNNAERAELLEGAGVAAPNGTSSSSTTSLRVGQVVACTYRDTYAGAGEDGNGLEVTKRCLVLELTKAEDGSPEAVVAFFDAPSHPIAVDQLQAV